MALWSSIGLRWIPRCNQQTKANRFYDDGLTEFAQHNVGLLLENYIMKPFECSILKSQVVFFSSAILVIINTRQVRTYEIDTTKLT
ncbi:hypothetical protein OUZ56_032862 [Daphnia magna]|uniref:Uncharacterized protein n=1 Tax=Daphnia magna TaxID=35525 RepID=A0ABR0B9P8_9CRUS|nr:hypothetical protein OUZ56_032862 [Daphnia magna]